MGTSGYGPTMAWDDVRRTPEEQRGFDLVGSLIRRKRVALGWSQRTLEAYSGIDQTVISRIENGKQYGLRWVRFARLVDALDGLELSRPPTDPLPRRQSPW
jgi:transcriptional regulator with XRE-family HTH domain